MSKRIVLVPELRSAFRSTLNMIDDFLIVDGKLHLARFEALFQLYGESIADFNAYMIGDKANVLDAYGDCTLKHQVFDYAPYHKYPARTKNKSLFRDSYDLSLVMTIFMMGNKSDSSDEKENELFLEMNAIRVYEKVLTKIKRARK
jgi:hypothetical protein